VGENSSALCPRIGRAHIDDADHGALRLWRAGPVNHRHFPSAYASPEDALDLQEHRLINRVGIDFDDHPFAPTGEDRQKGPSAFVFDIMGLSGQGWKRKCGKS
jgi:hypothetical protein